MPALVDLTGYTFGHLTVISRADMGGRRVRWDVVCSCGVAKTVAGYHLKSGHVTSCGCRKGQNQKTGADSPSWKGGRRIEDGYALVYLPRHPRAKSNGYVREHVLVMEDNLGRPLVGGENVHHKNGVRSDNRPENLELWSVSQAPGQRVSDKVEWALQILKQYGNDPEEYR